MSWVTDVLLLASLDEVWLEDEGEQLLVEIEFEALKGINDWLATHGYTPLINLDEVVSGSGNKAMQALVYGGAFNYLDEEEFLRIVRNQKWQSPEKVQILMKSETEDIFSFFPISISSD